MFGLNIHVIVYCINGCASKKKSVDREWIVTTEPILILNFYRSVHTICLAQVAGKCYLLQQSFYCFSEKYDGRLPYKEEIAIIGAKELIEACEEVQTPEHQCQTPLRNKFDFSNVQNYRHITDVPSVIIGSSDSEFVSKNELCIRLQFWLDRDDDSRLYVGQWLESYPGLPTELVVSGTTIQVITIIESIFLKFT